MTRRITDMRRSGEPLPAGMYRRKRPMRIAIVDDCAPDAKTLEDAIRSHLDKRGRTCEICRFRGGGDLLETTDALAFDLVFLDVFLDGANGIDIAERLRRENYPGLIIFTTVSSEHAVDGFRVRAFHYLTKPFTPDDIAAALDEAIERLAGDETMLRIHDGSAVINVPLSQVRSITADGMLMTTRIGGPILPTLDGEYCRIHTRDGRIYTGTILSLSPAAHVFDDVLTRPRDEKNLAVRIDEVVEDRAGVEALGIAPGDFVCIDPKTVVTDSGFLKSRFIDDKGSAACLLTLLRLMHIAGQRPRYDTEVCFTVHEEVGHGGATLPQVDELLAVDMGCVGDDLSCTERQVSICAKDNGGPYDYGMVTRLVELARANAIPYAVDIYPHYSSDITVAWHAGIDARGALIGPGVHASHGMERTHFEGMKATIDLTALYLELG